MGRDLETPEKDHGREEEKHHKPEEIPAEQRPEYVPVEGVSYSFLFFLISGGLLLVTLWSFWDDEFSRRGFKKYQDIYSQSEYYKARDEWKKASEQIAAKEKEILASLHQESGKLNESPEYQKLATAAREAQVRLNDQLDLKKFSGSRLDEAYYYFKKAQHSGQNVTVEKARVESIQKEIEAFGPIIEKRKEENEQAESKLLQFKANAVKLENELRALTDNRDGLLRKMDYFKPFPFIWRISEIKQTVIPGATRNNFAEIVYKVDRCMTCHLAYDDPHYEKSEQPLKSHPNIDIYIKKHSPGITGCTWCHKGQGAATAPTDDAHGSHHETDQSAGFNEPILKGNFMQSQCRNCHDQVLELPGAVELSKGKKLFLKLGCHGCHIVEGFEDAEKVGPSLTRIAAKVNRTWLYKWIKNPKEYLPKTRMPDFGLDEKDTLAVSAYLLASSDPNYKHPETFKGGDPEKGQKLFESVGCLACHELEGKGEVFGPDLSKVAGKVDPDWLVSWLSNPKEYNDKSRMPDLRLSVEDASDIASYLLRFSKQEHDPEIENKMSSRDLVEQGKVVVRRRGCFACHDIPGMENEGRIAPELSAFGGKQTWELEFGDSHIPHTWEAWARNKLKNPSLYRTERVLDKMPNFHLAPEEIESLLVLLKGFNGQRIPEKYRRVLSEKEQALETGRRLVDKFNCRGCHSIEGEGGLIQKYISGTFGYPPPLDKGPYHVGERIKASWLFSFLKNPTPVRKWVKVRMPTFFFSDKEVRDITAYFEALVVAENRYEPGINVKKQVNSIENGVKIANYMDCGKCHDDGAKGIEFSIAAERLRQDWIPKWIKDTRELIPDTKMPSHFEKKDGKHLIRSQFSKLNSVEGGDVDKIVSNISDFIISYNSAQFDPDLSLGSAEDAGAQDEADEDEASSGKDNSATESKAVKTASKKKSDDEEEEDD